MRNFTIVIVLLFISLAKTVNAQVVIAKPNLGFSQACASTSFNTYNITFSFSPSTALLSTNQFVVELSDASGSFSNPTVVYTSAQGAVTTSPATLSFSLPITTAGEAYKVRVKSTAPAATSSNSDAFPAYYKIQDTPFTINNLIETAAYCSGSSYLLTIDNPGFGDNDSPLQYPSLTFNWYKETGATTSVFVASGETLAVSEPGTYFAETNYGTCTSNSFSNRVTVSEASSNTTTSISSSLGNPYCSSEGATTLSTINGESYQWFKDGNLIPDATDQMYTTNEAGEYSVSIDLGNCVATASINLENTGFTSSIDVESSVMLNEGETLVATVTTDAISPQFEWYLNDALINGETGNSYEVLQAGNYRVVVNQTSGCIASNEFEFSVIEAFPNVANIPNLISPNGDGINDTWIIPQEYVAGTNTEVVIMSSKGEIVLQTNDYQNNWPVSEINFKGVNPVYYYIITTQNNETKKGSITVVE
ncbi:gliding motility-associated C-terminal domain-containing protein [Flavobacteriaceae bacterium XHP0103]|uniref:T9SS type B sorting domain-containing protein n=1 Tax=Marixanthotalea marina TaxID=2844359 RepID=UPI002989E7D5|nr:gliding motility-associated C-terminal domain-containing protein [Marixanthotalea marina]MBU3821445.1 gliding motility-associated C-terminal domain-containing protein [Marixanthotalea marina]